MIVTERDTFAFNPGSDLCRHAGALVGMNIPPAGGKVESEDFTLHIDRIVNKGGYRRFVGYYFEKESTA